MVGIGAGVAGIIIAADRYPANKYLVFTKFSAILGIIRTMDEIGTWLINGPFNPIKNMVSDCSSSKHLCIIS